MKQPTKFLGLPLGFALILLGFSTLIAMSAPAQQNAPAAPTLVPPTLVPLVDNSAASIDALPTESALKRIAEEQVVRVGVLYNAPPFSELNIRGIVSGFDADLANSMASAWGINTRFIQVTRQTGIDMLNAGEIDLLMGAQVHRRERDGQVEFSQSYYQNSQSIMIRNDDVATTPADMAGRRVGVVLGTPSEVALVDWQQRSGTSIQSLTFLTLDRAFSALAAGDVDGIVSNRLRLSRLTDQPGTVRILEQGIVPEPYAIAMRRQDVNLRNLVNHTLQFLVNNGRMNEIHQVHFNGATYPDDLVSVWANLGEDASQLSQYPTDMPFPQQYAVSRVLEEQVIRVAGVLESPENAVESARRFDALNRALIEAMAGRWGVHVDYVPNSADNPVEFVINGQADLAVGIEPDWNLADRVDFTRSYLLHGQRLLVPANSQIFSFNELRGGKWVGIFASEPGTADRVNALAESVNTAVNIFTIVREQDTVFHMTVEDNIDVAFGDSLKLIPHVQNDPNDVKLTDRWYSRSYAAFAVPRNDLDFRLLVEYTLQEIDRDGTLYELLQPVMLPDEIPSFEVWPGPSTFLSFNLAGN